MSLMYRQKPMSWEYVAAFFDGEGCLRVSPLNCARESSISVTLQIFQSQRQSAVLDEMTKFLRRQGLTPGRYKEQLHLGKREEVTFALGQMIPYLRVKRDHAIECHSYLKEVAKLSKQHGRQWYGLGYRPSFVPQTATERRVA